MSGSPPSRQPDCSHPTDEQRSAARHGARLNARLRFRISLLKSKDGAEVARARAGTPLPELVGRTRNLSETGLALALQDIQIGEQVFNDAGSTLLIKLDLPLGTVAICATPVRCKPLGDGARGYLLGVRITEMDDREWVSYVRFLRSLG